MGGKSQFTAIPLLKNEDSTLNPQPNFLVIDNIFDFKTIPFQYPDGTITDTEVATVSMRIVYRENLPAVDGKEKSYREVVFDEPDNVQVPYLQMLQARNQLALIENEDMVNYWLSMFSFRGCLEGFDMIYDRDRSLDLLGLLEEEVSS